MGVLEDRQKLVIDELNKEIDAAQSSFNVATEMAEMLNELIEAGKDARDTVTVGFSNLALVQFERFNNLRTAYVKFCDEPMKKKGPEPEKP